MANNGKNAVTKAQAEAHRRILQLLLRTEDNRRCADCLARGPTWASVNLGLFVCLNCSGIHRSLGTDLSKVRSTTLDTWLPEQVAFVQRMGNRRANLFWEGRLPRNYKRPAEGDMLGLRHFINDKYRDQRFALQTWDRPPTIETYTVHPFLKQLEGADPLTPPENAEEDGSSTSAPASRRSLPPGILEPAQGRRSRSSGDAGSLKTLDPPLRLGNSLKRVPSPSVRGPQARAAAAPTTPELFDLLSLNEPESAPSPSVQDVLLPGSVPHTLAAPPKASHKPSPSQESFGDTASSDGGWNAFVSGAATNPSAPIEETWDAFQNSAAPNAASSTPDPFGTQDIAAAPALENASFQPKFPSAPPSPTPQPPSPEKRASHRPQKSAEEIMRMYDQPKQQEDLFAAFAQSTGTLPANFQLPAPSAEGIPHPSLWPPFQMPMGAPNHNDLTFPSQMFEVPTGFPGSLPPFPDADAAQGGWATLPPMSFGGSTKDFGKHT